MAGRTLLEYWLATLALEKVQNVLVLAEERVDQIQQLAREGLPWGINVQVRYQPSELTPAQAIIEYQKALGTTPPNKNIAVLDHFPGLAQFPMFMSYAGWFAALQAWLPRARMPDRVGATELAPQVWVGLRTRISRRATLHAPCWIEEDVVMTRGSHPAMWGRTLTWGDFRKCRSVSREATP
jgi:hypothetical protein